MWLTFLVCTINTACGVILAKPYESLGRSSELVRVSLRLCIKNKRLLQSETIASYNIGLMNQMQIQNLKILYK